MALKVDIRVPVGLPVKDTADFIAKCEDAGFSGVGVHDHQHSGRDVYLTLALAAERTSRLPRPPPTHQPSTRIGRDVACLAHTLEALAPGGCRVPVGPGCLSVGHIGRARASVQTMRETILTIRRLLAGESVVFNATDARMRNVSTPPTPVYMTAAGPRMVELAGEVADGVLLLVGLHPKAIAAARQRLEAGARRAGRDLNSFNTIFITPMTVDEDGAAARAWPQRWFRPGQPWLTYPSSSNLFWLREAGIELPDGVRPEQISTDMAERICDAFGLFGTPEECLQRLRRAQSESGVEHVFIFPSHTVETGYDMPYAELEVFQRVIFPGLPGFPT